MSVAELLLPGATIGMLGSGQLGRMFAMAARRMGYRVEVLSPTPGSPTGQVADREVVAAYDDADAVSRFASAVDVVTLEFENIPSASVRAASAHAPVRPGERALHLTQHRAREKRFLAELGVPHVEYAEVKAGGELDAALRMVGPDSVVKTAGFGYDGKGQVRVSGGEGLREARALARAEPVVVERLVDLEAELSVVVARGLDGRVVAFAPALNHHVEHILDVSVTPAPVSAEAARQAVEIAEAVVQGLDLVGVACVEFFLDRGGALFVNEIAPRPHNSGHLTIEGAETSQFEQQLRAITGLPLGSTTLRRPAALANLLGQLWAGGEPDWGAALGVEGVELHLYGKNVPRRGRKMGHLTATAAEGSEAERRVRAARRLLAAGMSEGPE